MAAGFINLLVVLFLIHVSVPVILAHDEDSLKYVNALFRHGDRTLVPLEVYPNDDITERDLESSGYGYLTNDGKRRAYRLGMHLKKRYGDFLGEVYQPNLLYSRTSDLVRTKMTLMLVLAALFPSVKGEKWDKDMRWQPVPYNTVPLDKDNLLNSIYYCSLHRVPYEQLLRTSDYVKQLEDKYRDTMVLASRISGANISALTDLSKFATSVNTKRSLGIKTGWPEDKDEDLRFPPLAMLNLHSWTPLLKRCNGGVILHQMIKNMNKAINGTAMERMSLYSAHDVNVAAVLTALGIKLENLPTYTSAVIIELHHIDDAFYVKVLHYEGISEKIEELHIMDCDLLCPFEAFVEKLKNVTASSEDICGGEIIDNVFKRKFISLGYL